MIIILPSSAKLVEIKFLLRRLVAKVSTNYFLLKEWFQQN